MATPRLRSRFDGPPSPPPRRVLVIQTAFLGDVVLTTPLFRAVRRLWPDRRLDALVTPQAAALVAEDPHLDRVLTYDKKGGESFGSVLRTVRAGRYDVVLAPHRSPRTALLCLLSGIRVRVGFADAGLSRAYNRRVVRPRDLHEVDRNLSLLEGVGARAAPDDRRLHVGYTERERAEVATVLEEAGIGPEEPVVALAPGSVWATKRWDPKGFAAVGRGLRERGFRVALLGGPDDREVTATVARGIGTGATDAAGRTGLKALAAWMDRVRLVVTNDSSPLHVAAARGTPTVAVFGATTRGLGFGPFHGRSRVVETALECRPCGLHGGERCPEGHFRCMGDIAPEAVLRACDELLEAT